MTDYLSLSRREEGGFYVNLNSAEIIIESLVISYSYNMKTPFLLRGKGDASLKLTEQQLIKLFSEYLRFNIHEECEYTSEGASFFFHCKVRCCEVIPDES